MGIKNLIIAHAAASTFAWTSDDCVAATQLTGQPTTWIDFAITSMICVAVCISVGILSNCIKGIIKKNRDKEKEKPETDEQEAKKQAWLETKDRYDAAWRFVNMCWKIQHPDPIKDKDGNLVTVDNTTELTPKDEERYAEAWNVVRDYISARPAEPEKANK